MELTHSERKVHRIMINNSNFGKFPLPSLEAYLRVLALRMNKSAEEVYEILKSLEEKEVIFIRDEQIELLIKK